MSESTTVHATRRLSSLDRFTGRVLPARGAVAYVALAIVLLPNAVERGIVSRRL